VRRMNIFPVDVEAQSGNETCSSHAGRWSSLPSPFGGSGGFGPAESARPAWTTKLRTMEPQATRPIEAGGDRAVGSSEWVGMWVAGGGPVKLGK
jgi:hypothetical protein